MADEAVDIGFFFKIKIGIFPAVASVAAGAQGLPIDGYMALLGAMLVFALMITPWAASAALKL